MIPHDFQPADKDFFYGVRCDETLRVLWSLGRGNTVSIGTLANYLEMNVEARRVQSTRFAPRAGSRARPVQVVRCCGSAAAAGRGDLRPAVRRGDGATRDEEEKT